ncbi:hypothetical protein D3C85_1675730 [compost metagenome]
MRGSNCTFPQRHHQRRSRYRIVNNHAAHSVDTLDKLWCHNLFRRTLRHNLSVTQRNQMRGVAARLIQIVQHRRQRIALGAVQIAQQLK